MQKRHIRRAWGSPPGTRGCAPALRVNEGMVDVVHGVMYYPVQPSDKGKVGMFKQTVKLLSNLWRQISQERLQRTPPEFFADSNEGIEIPRDDGVWR
eukprot:7472235-Pyramimonas_sp.AAC.1